MHLRRMRRLLPAAWVLALLLTPGIAYVAGARQGNITNAAKTPFPAFNRSSVKSERTFQAIDAALLDRMPLRAQAVDLHGRIAVEVFKDSPNPDVSIGKRGWLYYGPTLRPCRDGVPLSDPAATAQIIALSLRASGRRVMLTEPAAKLFIHTKDAPTIDKAQQRCARRLQDAVSRMLAKTPGGLDLDTPLRALERKGVNTFLRSDTHWAAPGRYEFVRRVLDFAQPGLSRKVGLHIGGSVQRAGDLGRFIGYDRTDKDQLVLARRPPAKPLRAGRIALVGDSQLERGMLVADDGNPSVHDVALPGQPVCNWSMVGLGQCDAILRAADSVMIESVGRDLLDVENYCWHFVSVAGERLRGGPGVFVRADGAPSPGKGQLVVGDNGEVRVRIRPTGGDVSRTPRLMRIPVLAIPGAPQAAVTMVQQPQHGRPFPCATPSQAVPGGSLFLPVPAGRRVSDIVVALEAPPGTRFGRPQGIPLTGRFGAPAGAARTGARTAR
jgi:hypothetical protein